jgi:hypothetical protein
VRIPIRPNAEGKYTCGGIGLTPDCAQVFGLSGGPERGRAPGRASGYSARLAREANFHEGNREIGEAALTKWIGGLIGVYLLLALAVAAGGAYGLNAGLSPRAYSCPENELALASGAAPKGTTGPPNRPVVLALRAFLWPWSLAKAVGAGASPADWFVMKYDWAPDACRVGPGMRVPPSVRA